MPVCAVWREARQLFSRSKAALRSPSAVMIRGRLALAEGRLALADGRMDGCGWAGGWDGIEPCWVDGWVIFSMAVLCGAAALLKTRARAPRAARRTFFEEPAELGSPSLMAVMCGVAAPLKTRAPRRALWPRRGPPAEHSSQNLQSSAPFFARVPRLRQIG